MNQIERSIEFTQAFDILEDSDDNLFITGRAGTGKSTFLEYFRKHTLKNVAVVAPTGVAALNVKGQTIHSFFKFKPRFLTRDNIKLRANRKLYENLDILIIDEISMVRADIFEGIEYFLRLNGPRQGEPFGGVQICVIGDLYQLPPIVSHYEKEVFYKIYETPFFFSSDAFEEGNFGVVELKKIYRQSEGEFIEALNNIRIGDTSFETISFINQRNVHPTPNEMSVILTTTNNIADRTNIHKLSLLGSKEFIYQGKMKGDFGLEGDKLPVPQDLKLKVGAQVMFTKNHSAKKWVNGTIGKVKSLKEKEIIVTVVKNGEEFDYNVKPERWETVRYSYDEGASKIKEDVKGEYVQYPLITAWAITIHKSQGKTLDHVVIDLGYGAFASGQLYVALSRCRSFKNIILKKAVTDRDVKCDPNIIEFSRKFVS